MDSLILRCPQCNGFGFTRTLRDAPIVCSNCKSADANILFCDDDLVVWRDPLTKQARLPNLMSKLGGFILDAVLICLGVAGILVVLPLLFSVARQTITIEELFTEVSASRLLFWVSIYCDLWLYYRVAVTSQQKPLTQTRALAKHPQLPLHDYDSAREAAKKVGIDASHYLAPEARRLLDQADSTARSWGQAISPAHLAYTLMSHKDVVTALFRLELRKADIEAGCKRVAHRSDEQHGSRFQEALLLAYEEARHHQRSTISTLELLVGCIRADRWLEALFDDAGVTLAELRQVVHWGNVVNDLLQREHRRRGLARSKPKTTMNRAMTARPTYLLDSISFDYTLQARANQFMPAIGRDREIKEAFRVLREGNNSVLLLGEPGVGKTTILEGIAELMTAEDVPTQLQDKRLVVTDPGAIIAGGGQGGGLEQKMEQLIHEIISAGNIIWSIEDIHTLLGAGSTNSSIDIGKILMNYISQGYIKVIGTSTTKEYQQFIERQEAFMRRFQVVHVSELDRDSAILVLEGRAPFIESQHRVFFTYNALVSCVDLTERFIKDRHLPAKALAVMEEAAILAQDQGNGATRLVTRNHVAQVVAEKTNVAVNSITETEAEKLLHLEDELHERVVGQDEAIVAIAKALRRSREDVRDTSRPIASFLLLGPTGVGKTETAKAIAATYFGDEHRMMRFDMSEYQEADAVARLIGSANALGALTEAVRQTPFGIVLLDEFEKASAPVHNLFLQVLDDGRLTDGMGRTIDFTNTMVIATSNAATPEIQTLYSQGLPHDAIRETLLQDGSLQKHYKLELLNRFDHIAVFTPLEAHELFVVGELLLKKVAKQLASKGVQLHWTEEAVAELVKHGYSPQFGARPLRRLIQDQVEDQLAELLLKQQLGRRDIVELQAGGKLMVYPAERI